MTPGLPATCGEGTPHDHMTGLMELTWLPIACNCLPQGFTYKGVTKAFPVVIGETGSRMKDGKDTQVR